MVQGKVEVRPRGVVYGRVGGARREGRRWSRG